MTAILKIYSDNVHTTELTHTTNVSTTVTCAAGATQLTLTSATGMPTAGVIDIVDGLPETISYFGLSGNVIQLAKVTASAHTAATVNQWYYSLPIGDQTNGIPNDGTNATPVSTNTYTAYIYNSGDQTAQTPTIATSNTSPSTTSGYTDTVVSTTSSTTGFSTSVTPSNITAGSQQQFWACAQVPSGQSAIGNPQICVINLTYGTV